MQELSCWNKQKSMCLMDKIDIVQIVNLYSTLTRGSIQYIQYIHSCYKSRSNLVIELQKKVFFLLFRGHSTASLSSPHLSLALIDLHMDFFSPCFSFFIITSAREKLSNRRVVTVCTRIISCKRFIIVRSLAFPSSPLLMHAQVLL